MQPLMKATQKILQAPSVLHMNVRNSFWDSDSAQFELSKPIQEYVCQSYLANSCILDDINNCYFHPNLDDLCHPNPDDINNCYSHPNLDDQCHPILDDINSCYFHSNLDDQCLDDINSCYFYPNLDDQCHPILDDINNCYFHPNLDDQCHPILDVNCVILSLYREIDQKTSIFG